MTDATYRIVGGLGARERVVATGLTRAAATARAAALQRDAIRAGMWFAIEEERSAAGWDQFVGDAGKLHRR